MKYRGEKVIHFVREADLSDPHSHRMFQCDKCDSVMGFPHTHWTLGEAWVQAERHECPPPEPYDELAVIPIPKPNRQGMDRNWIGIFGPDPESQGE
jgi:hypothetical protein